MTTAKIAVTPSLAGAPITTHSMIGGGILGAANVEVVKNVRFLASGMYGPGTGRYMIGMGPQVVVVPVPAVAGGACLTGDTGGCDAHLSPVRAGDILLGTEIQMGPKSQRWDLGPIWISVPKGYRPRGPETDEHRNHQ